jgi:predicted RNA-binding Zn ribbon-like protein
MAGQPRDPLPYGVLRGFGGTTYAFDAGAVSLQFVATGGEAERAVFETLHTPADLGRWLAASPLAVTVAPTADDLAAAKRLREALWEIAWRRARFGPHANAPATYVRTVNAAAAASPLVPALDEADSRRAGWASPATTAAALSTLARDAVDLFAGPRADRIRQCEGGTCRLVFVDTSRPGRRRWCSMQRCGNLHKQRALRERLREGAGEDG